MKKYILLLFIGFNLTLNAQTIELAVPHVKQDKTEWCSAAVSKSVLDYHGINKSQCNIMEYVRAVSSGYGAYGCCSPDPPGFEHPCNKPVPLGFGNEQGSVKGILMHFGNLVSEAALHPINTYNIENELTNGNPIVVQWNYYNPPFGGPDAHAIVIYKIVDKTEIHFMDPALNDYDWLSYNDFYDNEEHRWAGTLTCQNCSRDYPCHCYNGEQDEDETGMDCGGSCPECYVPPPPPPGCDNCIKDSGEEKIDCGGTCPSCYDVIDALVITSTAQLRSEMMAFKKITAKDATTVASGKTVSFITEEEGSVILLPGFKAEKGSKFSTQRWEDLSGYSRECGSVCISVQTFPSIVYRNLNEWFYVDNLHNAVKIGFDIYDIPNGDTARFIYGNVINVTYNGRFNLWDCKTGALNTTGEVPYHFYYTIDYCDGPSYRNNGRFVVMDKKGKSNSSPDEPEDPEILNTPQFSSSDNLKIQNEMSTPAFSIIPNPNTGTFQLETNFPLSEIAHLKITDMLGGSVYETKKLTTNTIQLQNTTNGLFFVVIILKDGNLLTQKMMVKR